MEASGRWYITPRRVAVADIRPLLLSAGNTARRTPTEVGYPGKSGIDLDDYTGPRIAPITGHAHRRLAEDITCDYLSLLRRNTPLNACQ